MKVYTTYTGMVRFWGPWLKLEAGFVGNKPFILHVETQLISNMPAPFDGQIWFFPPNNLGEAIVREFPCPGKTLVQLAANTLQQPEVRFRSLSVTRLVVEVIVGGSYPPTAYKVMRDYKPPTGYTPSTQVRTYELLRNSVGLGS